LGFVSGLLGTAGGANGSGFAAPASANILNPTTVAQANTAYQGNQDALSQQQAFLNATQAQNGLGNQSSVYNQLQGVTNGTGPNPAQAQLAQATGANVANQAALMAGQRGAGQNAGLIARQAAQQGANTQQQSAGQAATLQAQQSLNALNAQGSIANTQAAQQAAATGANTSAQQGEQGQILGGIASQNTANVGMQSNINTANASLASNAQSQQGNMLGNLAGGLGSAMTTLAPLAMMAAEGGKVPSRQMMANGGGAYMQAPDMTDSQWNTVATVPQQTPVAPNASISSMTPSTGPKSNVGKSFATNADGTPKQGMSLAGSVIGTAIGKGLNSLFGSSTPSSTTSEDYYGKSASEGDSPIRTEAEQEMDKQAASDPSVNLMGPQPSTAGQTTQDQSFDPDKAYAAKGGKVPAMVSPGEQYIPPEELKAVKEGKKDPLKAGERIPGEPEYPGNDYRNDIVPKTLKEDGLVIPNEVMQSKNPHWAAMRFVQQHMAQGGRVMPSKPKKMK
jgi:hypothetical protein